MFTGIVQAVGQVRDLQDGVLTIFIPDEFEPGSIGDSIAVNGCCLTLRDVSGKGLLRRAMDEEAHRDEGVPFEPREAPRFATFDLSEETLLRTTFPQLQQGMRVNLETAATISTLFGGHIVQGHVDCTGEVVRVSHGGQSSTIRFKTQADQDRFLIDKGSVTVDGISLTVVDPVEGEFDTWIIPHTLEHTNLSDRKPGDLVNLEFDVIAKHVDKLLQYRM